MRRGKLCGLWHAHPEGYSREGDARTTFTGAVEKRCAPESCLVYNPRVSSHPRKLDCGILSFHEDASLRFLTVSQEDREDGKDRL